MDKKIEKEIVKEFKWLQKTFPLRFITIDMYINSLQAKVAKKNEILLCDFFSRGKAEVNIMFLYDTENPLTQTDIFTINQLNIKKEYLPFWYLYHEYGHAIEIDKHTGKEGIENTKKWLEKIENEIQSTHYKNVFSYKETVEEKNADLFAIRTYMNRVKEWSF